MFARKILFPRFLGGWANIPYPLVSYPYTSWTVTYSRSLRAIWFTSESRLVSASSRSLSAVWTRLTSCSKVGAVDWTCSPVFVAAVSAYILSSSFSTAVFSRTVFSSTACFSAIVWTRDKIAEFWDKSLHLSKYVAPSLWALRPHTSRVWLGPW